MMPLEGENPHNSLLKLQYPISNEKRIFIRIENPLKEFHKNLTNLIDEPISKIIKNLSSILGYGCGSTPESDDIFLGILATIYCLNPQIGKEFEFLSQIPFEKLTTNQSARLCRRFLKQNFPSDLITFLKLLKTPLYDDQVKIRFEHEIRKIRRIGTSSGYYFLMGVLWELKYATDHISLSIKK